MAIMGGRNNLAVCESSLRSWMVRSYVNNRAYVQCRIGGAKERERAGAESIKQRQADNEEETTTNGNVEACIYSILF